MRPMPAIKTDIPRDVVVQNGTYELFRSSRTTPLVPIHNKNTPKTNNSGPMFWVQILSLVWGFPSKIQMNPILRDAMKTTVEEKMKKTAVEWKEK